MAVAVLALLVIFMLLAGGVRTLIQRRRTGDTGNRRTWAARGSLEWWGLTVADLGYLTVGLGAPVAALAGMPPLASLTNRSCAVWASCSRYSGSSRPSAPSWRWRWAPPGGSASTKPNTPRW